MTITLDIQNVCQDPLPVSNQQMTEWVTTALHAHQQHAELTLRLVDSEEITDLNHTYRKYNKPTNVLAFPSNLPDNIVLDAPFLGDVIICPTVLKAESITLNTPLTAHWAHIIVHGVLHLLGYDHMDEKDTEIMQTHEIKILQTLGFNNPYATENNQKDNQINDD